MLIDLFRCGRDAELRFTADGKPVANVPLAYDVGFGDRKRTGWIELTIWGDRAERLSSMLNKGTQLYCQIKDIEIESYTKRDGGAGAKLKGVLVDLKFAGGGDRAQGDGSQQQAPASRSQQSKPPPQQQAPDMDDDDIPF